MYVSAETRVVQIHFYGHVNFDAASKESKRAFVFEISHSPDRAVDSISKPDGPRSKKCATNESFYNFTFKMPKNRVGYGPHGPPSSYSHARAVSKNFNPHLLHTFVFGSGRLPKEGKYVSIPRGILLHVRTRLTNWKSRYWPVSSRTYNWRCRFSWVREGSYS